MTDSPSSSRRNFLKQGTTAALAAGLTTQLNSAVHAQGSDRLKVGLVGCGGRGTGAARQVLTADQHSDLHAVADAFEDRLEVSLQSIRASNVGERVTVDADRKFVGFDAYKGVIDSCDVVLLATPPHFRPMHLRAAVEAGKHVFVEKPVGVDAPGIRSVLESCKLGQRKGLSIVSGLCWRYHTAMMATFQQIHEGLIGEITAMQCSYNSNGVWDPRRTREECGSDMEYQMRNWYYYTWLSGDFNTEQHVHSLDKMAWAMQDEYPVSVSGTGGRIQRTAPKYGNIYDHFDVVYEYANGVKAFSRCRHFSRSSTEVRDYIFGTKGRVDCMAYTIYDWKGNVIWKFDDPNIDPKRIVMHQLEQDAFMGSIRDGKPINNGYYMSMSSLMAIAGRMSSYTGQTLSWEDCLNSKLDLSPPSYEWGPLKMRPVSIPGITKFV
jgi:predicted dehydrogenase